MVSFLCFVLVVLFGQSCAGTSSAYHHRTTSLAELKEIDSYVSSGLPLFDHGFFVSTGKYVKCTFENCNFSISYYKLT
jgi:hypothetical protein